MKKSFWLAGSFSLALMFAACGDDSSSNGSVDQETDESSSSVEDSTDGSSSSAEYKPFGHRYQGGNVLLVVHR